MTGGIPLAPLARLAARRRTELRRKAGSLAGEFTEWRAASALGGPYEKHQSQIARISRRLEALGEELTAELDDAGDDDAFLASAVELEQHIVDLHRLWEFFRRKLALRSVAWFRDPLLVLDEFAWRCYEPALSRARAAAQKSGARVSPEPPLVFFNGGVSPFVLPRDVRFEAEEVIDEGSRVGTAAVAEALKLLPVPVIGVPWFQIEHLPESLVVAHEVGHVVLEEFALGTAVGAAVDAAVPAAHRAAWQAWLHEVFADVYGALSAGPAFGLALRDFISSDRASVATDVRVAPNWYQYPTVTLRILITAEALRLSGFPAEGEALSDGWSSAYPASVASDHAGDVAAVVAAMVDTPLAALGGVPLREAVTFGAARHKASRDEAARLMSQGALQSKDVRTLLAAARLAFDEEPDRYVEGGAQGRVMKKAVADAVSAGVRAGARRSAAETAAIDADDAAAGAGLLRALRKG